jgi:hypothetical protein
MTNFFNIVWKAVRSAVLSWIYRDRVRSIRVEELHEAPKSRNLYFIGSRNPWSAAFLCPCGCGELIQLSLLKNDSPSWSVTFDRYGFATLFPSVWRTKGCRSHFFLRRGAVVWCRDELALQPQPKATWKRR